jgi:hypothetical protein
VDKISPWVREHRQIEIIGSDLLCHSWNHRDSFEAGQIVPSGHWIAETGLKNRTIEVLSPAFFSKLFLGGDFHEFLYTLNDGPVQQISLPTGVYCRAAAAIPAFHPDAVPPFNIKIWVEPLVNEYGPYYYVIEHDGAEVQNAVPL